MDDRIIGHRQTQLDVPIDDVALGGTALMSEQASQAQVSALQSELAEMRDRWIRAEAETLNVRARSRKDVDDAKQYGIQKFATDAVEAAENLRRGLDSVPDPTSGKGSLEQLHDGVAGIERSFLAMLGRNGIKRDDPTGSAYDPASQQAMGEEESSAHPPGTVLRSLTSTWTLNGRLLRPALVVVAKRCIAKNTAA